MSDDLFELGLKDDDRIATTFAGGIPKGGVVLIEGDNGTGKSVWAQRFAYGICSEGHTVSFVSAEETARSFIDQMGSLSYSVAQQMVEQRMLFLNADVNTQEHVGGGGDVDGSLVENFLNSDALWRSDLVVTDNFGEILRNDSKFDKLMSEGEVDHAMQSVNSYFEKLMNQGKTVVVCINPHSVSDEAIRPLRAVSTVHLSLSTREIGGDIARSVEVKQYKNMPGNVDDTIGFGVQSGQGIVIESRTIA